MASGGTGWTLVGFLERFELWEKHEKTPGDLSLIVADWILSRHTDPYRGARREPGFDNLWFAPIPNTLHGDGLVVACSYWIIERNSEVRCNLFGSLHWPI